jgi:hypothetical protein
VSSKPAVTPVKPLSATSSPSASGGFFGLFGGDKEKEVSTKPSTAQKPPTTTIGSTGKTASTTNLKPVVKVQTPVASKPTTPVVTKKDTSASGGGFFGLFSESSSAPVTVTPPKATVATPVVASKPAPVIAKPVASIKPSSVPTVTKSPVKATQQQPSSGSPPPKVKVGTIVRAQKDASKK